MKVYVRLDVLSEKYSPGELVKKIGIAGDNLWRKGDIRGKSKIVEKENGWSINSRVALNDDLIDHLMNLQSQVCGCEKKIYEISNLADCLVQVSCAIYYKEEPPLGIEKSQIDWLSKIGACLDIDLYRTELD